MTLNLVFCNTFLRTLNLNNNETTLCQCLKYCMHELLYMHFIDLRFQPLSKLHSWDIIVWISEANYDFVAPFMSHALCIQKHTRDIWSSTNTWGNLRLHFRLNLTLKLCVWLVLLFSEMNWTELNCFANIREHISDFGSCLTTIPIHTHAFQKKIPKGTINH